MYASHYNQDLLKESIQKSLQLKQLKSLSKQLRKPHLRLILDYSQLKKDWKKIMINSIILQEVGKVILRNHPQSKMKALVKKF